MKYIRTKDGRLIDVQKFIEEEKKNPYYTDYEFEEIKNEEDCCSIHWTAIGTKENSQKDQVGRRCQFGASVDSPFISQADTIEELCEEFVVIYESGCHALFDTLGEAETQLYTEIYGAIWTDKGLIYVAKMNESGELESIMKI